MTDRDTKFREGFAQLLLEDIEPDLFDIAIHNDPDGAKQRIKDKFAQRAYDLVAHTLHELGIDEDVPFNDATTPGDIPDLTQWPD